MRVERELEIGEWLKTAETELEIKPSQYFALVKLLEDFHNEQLHIAKEQNLNEPQNQQLNIAGVINLLPCPFCGSKAEKRVREGTSDYDLKKVYYDIRCTNNDCYLQDGADWNCETYEEVVEMWNKRQ